MRSVFVLCLALVSGCASTPSWEAENLDRVRSPGSSAIVFELNETQGAICGSSVSTLLMAGENGRTVELSNPRGMLDNTSPLRLHAINPGLWLPIALHCGNYGSFGPMPTSDVFSIALGHLGHAVEVRAGEIVYPGTIQTYRGPTGIEARLVDESSVQRHKLSERAPDLLSRLVVRFDPLRPPPANAGQ